MTKKIAFVLPSLAGGGAERVTLNLLAGLDQDRYRSELILLDRSGPFESLLPPGLTVKGLGHARLRTALPSLILTLREADPDLVFSTIGYVNIGLAALRSFFPGRLVLREANLPSLSLPNWPFPSLAPLAYSLFYPRADLVLATSQRMVEELCHFGVAPDRLSVLPNPVSVDAIRAGAAKPMRASGPGPRFVSAGRLTAQKGFDVLIPMISEVPGAHLTILGDGPERNSLEALVRQCHASVQFQGFVDNAAAWFSGADAVVIPSRWEGMPNVALEALACGTPVIATPTSGGIAELAAATCGEGVRIAPIGPAFVRAMRAVQPKPRTELQGSLLPAEYEIENAVQVFSRLLDGVLRGS